MASDTLRIVATFQASDGKTDELRSVLETLVEPSHAEDGCLGYELLQSLDDPTQFTFVEEWRDTQAIEAHAQSDHFKNGMGKLKGLLAGGPDLRRCRLIK